MSDTQWQRKAIPVRAIQFDGDNGLRFLETGLAVKMGMSATGEPEIHWFKNMSAVPLVIQKGWWLIRQGEQWLRRSPQQFDLEYEEVPNDN